MGGFHECVIDTCQAHDNDIEKDHHVHTIKIVPAAGCFIWGSQSLSQCWANLNFSRKGGERLSKERKKTCTHLFFQRTVMEGEKPHKAHNPGKAGKKAERKKAIEEKKKKKSNNPKA